MDTAQFSLIFVLFLYGLLVIAILDTQMVDRLDEGAIAAVLGPLDYKGLYKV